MIAAARNRSVRSSSRSIDADVQQLGERPGVERERDLDRDGFVAGGRAAARAGARDHRDLRRLVSAATRAPSASHSAGDGVPAQAELGEARDGLGPGRRLDLGRGQQVGEGVEVVADADPALGARLERRRAAAGERIEDDVAGPRVARDERVGQGGREAREVRAHRVERVAPQPLLVLPLGRQGHRRQFERQLQGELARGQTATRAAESSAGEVPTWALLVLACHAPNQVGAMGRGA